MWLRTDPSVDKLLEDCLARLKTDMGQSTSKQFVSKPNPIGVHNVAFAIIRNLAQPSFSKILVYLRAVDSAWLAR
jgi:hypothetical protein